MMMYKEIVAISLSIIFIWGTSIYSPLLILQNWSDGELLRLLSIFIFLFCLQLVCKIFKARNLVILLVLVLIVLTHFEFAAVAALGLLALTAAVIGRKLTSNLQWIKQADLAMHLTIGYALLLGVLQVSVHFAVNTRELFTLVPIVFLSICYRETAKICRELAEALRMPFRMEAAAFVLPAGVALSMLVFVALPETHSDALIVNLRMTHQVQINGMWDFASDLNSWASWPKGAVWLSTAHYLLAGEAGARLFNWFAIFTTSLLLYREAVRLGFTTNTWLSVALFLSTPIAFWCSFVLFDDAVFGLFVTAAIISAVNSSEKLTPGGVFVTLLLCSAAMATKITGLLILPVIVAIYLYRFVILKPVDGICISKQQLMKYMLAGLPIMIIGTVPYIFSYIKTGNPIFPLYNDIFKAENYPVVRFQDLRWSSDLGWDSIYKMASNSSMFMEGKNWTFGVQHALLFIPVAIEIFLRRKNVALVQYGLAIVIFSVLVFSQMHYIRYLYPMFPIYAILVASFLHRANSREMKKLVYAVSILVIAINLVNVKSLNMLYSFDFKSWAPVETRNFVDYSEKSLNETVNLEYGKSAKVLYLHRAYSAGLDGTALNYHWASHSITAAVDSSKNLMDVARLIREFGITHIILDEDISKSTPSLFTSAVASISRLQRQVGSSQLWKISAFIIIGEEIKLNGKHAKDYLLSGWRQPEGWGVWAYADSAQIDMRILNWDKKSPILIRAFAMPYTPKNRTDSISIKIFVNGSLIQTVTLLSQQIQQELSFVVPENIIKTDGAVNIEFQFPEAFDDTQLQLGFSEISLEYK